MNQIIISYINIPCVVPNCLACAHLPTPPLNLRKGTHSLWSITFFRYFCALRKAILLIARAVSWVFCIHKRKILIISIIIIIIRKHHSWRSILRLGFIVRNIYFKMHAKVGATRFARFGLINRFVRITTHCALKSREINQKMFSGQHLIIISMMARQRFGISASCDLLLMRFCLYYDIFGMHIIWNFLYEKLLFVE